MEPEDFSLASILVLFAAVLSHVLPHPWWSFTAVGGALLLWGAREKARSFVLPVAILAISDWYLTRVVYGYEFHVGAYLITWTWYCLALILGRTMLRGGPDWKSIVAACGLSSTLFFLASNFAVWASPGSWYPHTNAGLMACFAAGLPFYRNDLFATTLLVGAVFAVPGLMGRLRVGEPGRV